MAIKTGPWLGKAMRRRAFIALLAATGAAWPSLARGQERGRIYRLGSLHQSPRNAPHHVAFYEELQRYGFVERQNLLSDESGYGLRLEQLAEHAAEIAKAQVDVIVAAGDAPVRAAQRVTKTIPVLALASDMVAQGFVRSLSNPEGNITGLSILAAELDGKRQEILMQAVPGARRMAALIDSEYTTPQRAQALHDAAHKYGVELILYTVSTPDEIAGAIERAKSSGAEALNVLASALLFNNRQIIFDRTVSLRIPAIYEWASEGEGAVLLLMVLASPSFIATFSLDNALSCFAAPSRPTCPLSSRPSSS
jgi:putative tryptophan/tyrosine transport system substrate-binding protein